MYKLKREYIQTEHFENLLNNDLSYMKKLGGYNELPEPMKEISMKEYFKCIGIYGSIYSDSKQITTENGHFIATIEIEYKHNYGYAWVKKLKDNSIKFYRLGCQHKFEETKIGNCLYKMKCEKCNFEVVVDSSD